MSDYVRNMAPAVRERNKALLEPKVAETLKERKPRGRPEGELQDEVIDHLQQLGYLVAHFRPAKVMRGGVEKYETPIGADGKGWPDLVAVHPMTKRVLVAELKSESGTVKEPQLEWLRAWQGVPGAIVTVLRPSSWDDLKGLL